MIVEAPGLHVSLERAQDLPIRPREHHGRKGLDAKKLGQSSVSVRIDFQGNELVVHHLDHARIQECGRIQLPAPETMLRAKIEHKG